MADWIPAALLRSNYLNLGTYRRSGASVDTPVWFAAHGRELVAFTQRESGKVKRLRNSARARIAACDARGRLTGPWLEVTARVIEDPERAEAAIGALRRRYGLQFRALEFFARLAGRRRSWAVLEIASALNRGSRSPG
jgi:hypothetical protein